MANREEIYHGTYSYKTDIGRVRKSNEDQAIVLMNSQNEIFMAVCDGMGGASKGDVASKLAIDTLSAAFKKKKKYNSRYWDKSWFRHVSKTINHKIYGMGNRDRSSSEPKSNGMGTTMVAALITSGHLLIANIGDSRAYRLNHRKLESLTEDQTYVAYLVRSGKITPEAALTHPDRHVLMNALGIYPSLSISINDYEYHGETILLCSDGLYNNLQENEIANILSTDERSDQNVMTLIATANHAGGSDNIGIALWECIAHD